MNLKLAEPQDAAGVLKLYDSLRDAPGCTWDEDYPAMREIEIDIQNGDLFIDADERGVRAAISICVDEELEAMNVWSESTMPAGSLMRVAVRADVQRRGIAREMVRFALNELKKRGFRGVHILVGRENFAAQRCYAPFGLRVAAQANQYGVDWYCMEGEL